MNLITAEHICKNYADRVILQDINFSINDGEKIGVIGINGTGKSTLLKLIAGLEIPDSGQLIKARNLRIEYLPQMPELPGDKNILEAVLYGQSPLLQLIREYEAAAAFLEDQPDDRVRQDRLIGLSGRMDDAKAWNLDNEVKSVLTRLGITDFRQMISNLSGGQKKRVALAAALVNPADLLILDEPTNHIDPAAVEWLEQYLANFQGALLMVTHDRYFLERVTKIMLEIDRTHVYRYEANYEKWLELKAERIEREQASSEKHQNLLRHELAWIRRGAKARSTKQKARIERFETLNVQEAPLADQAVSMTAAASRLGRKTLILDKIGKNWDGKPFIRDFSYIVNRHERLGLIGPNGCGKTTLLKIIAGILEPDSGSRDIGSTVRLGFFTQENDLVDSDLRVIEYIRQTAEIIQTRDGELTAAQMLERFLFPPELQWTPIRMLSGGEKRRLLLLSVLMGAPNILMLDEPTNDLDITTLSVLEDYLEKFPGAVIVVSHDRYFLDRVVERILAFESDGMIHQYEGNYQAYQQQIQPPEKNLRPDKQTGLPTDKNKINPAPDRLRLKMNEKREYETIDARIADLEKQREKLQAELDHAAHDYVNLQILTEKMAGLVAEYDQAMSRWLYLTELVEKIEQQKSNS